MKFLIILAIAILGAFAAPLEDDVDVAGDVTKVINEILEALPEPLLDLHDQDASLDLGFETLDFTFQDVVLSGIKSLEITKMDYDSETGRLDYVLTIPDTKADIEFDLVLAGILNAVNHPVIDIDLINFVFTGYAVVDTSSTPHQVTDFDLLITLEGAKVSLTGILNDDALSEKLTNVLNDQLPDILNRINLQLEPAASAIIKSLINIIIRLTA